MKKKCKLQNTYQKHKKPIINQMVAIVGPMSWKRQSYKTFTIFIK